MSSNKFISTYKTAALIVAIALSAYFGVRYYAELELKKDMSTLYRSIYDEFGDGVIAVYQDPADPAEIELDVELEGFGRITLNQLLLDEGGRIEKCNLIRVGKFMLEGDIYFPGESFEEDARSWSGSIPLRFLDAQFGESVFDRSNVVNFIRSLQDNYHFFEGMPRSRDRKFEISEDERRYYYFVKEFNT